MLQIHLPDPSFFFLLPSSWFPSVLGLTFIHPLQFSTLPTPRHFSFTPPVLFPCFLYCLVSFGPQLPYKSTSHETQGPIFFFLVGTPHSRHTCLCHWPPPLPFFFIRQHSFMLCAVLLGSSSVIFFWWQSSVFLVLYSRIVLSLKCSDPKHAEVSLACLFLPPFLFVMA